MDGNQKPGVFGIDPCAIGGEAARSDQHVNVRVQEHGAGPGMENGQSADTGPEKPGIVGEFLEGVRRGFHQ